MQHRFSIEQHIIIITHTRHTRTHLRCINKRHTYSCIRQKIIIIVCRFRHLKKKILVSMYYEWNTISTRSKRNDEVKSQKDEIERKIYDEPTWNGWVVVQRNKKDSKKTNTFFFRPQSLFIALRNVWTHTHAYIRLHIVLCTSVCGCMNVMSQ